MYLTDFGMSRMLKTTDATQQTAQNLGPIRWMAPESLLSSSYSTKSDAYMYAMFLYEVLVRRVPFYELSNLLDVYECIRDGQRPTIDMTCLPPVFRDIFHANWAVDPADRYDMDTIHQLFVLHASDNNEKNDDDSHEQPRTSKDGPSIFLPVITQYGSTFGDQHLTNSSSLSIPIVAQYGDVVDFHENFSL